MFDWLQYCVLEDIVKHVHDVARDDYFYEPKPRATAFKTFLEHLVKGSANKPNARSSVIKNPNIDDNDDDMDTTPTPPPAKMLKNKNPSLNGNQFTALVKKASSKYLVQDSVLTAEIRNVMVMFIKIVGLELEVMVDNSGGESSSVHLPGNIHHAIMSFSRSSFRASGGSGTADGGVRRSGGNLRGSVMGHSRTVAKGQSIAGVFDFIDRTANEVAADTLMLSRVQRCMEALCEVFTETGGQMRQFIVDDKGTVCIGTFGLRGSVGVDNAAAALETAKKIVIRLQALDLTASIGITSGKAYCGLVGSPSRHEYAVMGPSTNLSARLMCKAPPFGVICDIETKNRDRTHGFEPLNEVNAKGYAHPVMTFKPIFEDIVQHLRANTDSQVYAALSPMAAGGGSKRINVLRSSTDWYIGNLAKSQSKIFRGSFESVLGPLSVNLSGKGSTKNKLHMSPSNAALFSKRRGSVIVTGTDKDEALKQSTRKHKLHGRQDELRQILSFLFPSASASFMSLQDSVGSIATGAGLSSGSSIMGINTSSGNNAVDLDAMSESRMVVISGNYISMHVCMYVYVSYNTNSYRTLSSCIYIQFLHFHAIVFPNAYDYSIRWRGHRQECVGRLSSPPDFHRQ
ncbi:adenylate/guanylate cyclase domain-containing protein [archaeon]|nr:MAG: adenylate/guanylate cyclase domain-containing protein [archaeon]